MSSSEEESFECGLCLLDVRDIPLTPIWQCSEGHIQCNSCYNERGGASAVNCIHAMYRCNAERALYCALAMRACLLECAPVSLKPESGSACCPSQLRARCVVCRGDLTSWNMRILLQRCPSSEVEMQSIRNRLVLLLAAHAPPMCIWNVPARTL
jgi:hypothetical protein